MENWFTDLPVLRPSGAFVMVDGGATRSRAVVAEIDGSVSSYTEGKSTNARIIGDAAAARNIRDVLESALRNSGVRKDQLSACLIGSAATDTRDHAANLTSLVRQSLPGSCSIHAFPDSMTCWAATADLDPAVAVISGTGSVVFSGSMKDRQSYSFGYSDFLLADKGSGFAVGRAALIEACQFDENRSQSAILARACLDHLGLQRFESIPDAIHKPTLDKAAIAGLAMVVLQLAKDGDAISSAIISDQASQLAELVNAAIRISELDGAPVGCFGSMFLDDYYTSAFKTSLRSSGVTTNNVRFLVRAGLAGAFRLGIHFAGVSNGSDLFDTSIKRFEASMNDHVSAYDGSTRSHSEH